MTSGVVSFLSKDSILTPTGNRQTVDTEAWLEAQFTPPAGSTMTGWVIAAHCKETGDVRPELNVDGLVDTCTMLERLFNLLDGISPGFVAADFVLARAIIETGMVNAGPMIEGSKAEGPFQVSPAEWALFLNEGAALKEDNGDPLTKEFRKEDSESDRRNPQLQAYAALFRMHADTKAISKIRAAAGSSASDSAFLPTYLDVFHAYLLESPAAAVAVHDARASDADLTKSMHVILSDAFVQKPADEAKTKALVDALFVARGAKYLGTAAAPKNVGQFVELTRKVFGDALLEADKLIRRYAPEEVPPEPRSPTVILVAGIPDDVAPVPQSSPAPFARLGAPLGQSFWPVITKHDQAMVISYLNTSGNVVGSESRRFMANRRKGARYHAGLDVYCNEGDVVVACAKGKVVHFFDFYTVTKTHEHSYALLVDHGGVVINYGEVKANAREEFDWTVGDDVQAGQRIARVSGTRMIHFETYVPGTTVTSKWLTGDARPPSLLNPTMLLLTLASGAKRIMVDGNVSAAKGSGKIQTPTGQPTGAGDVLTLARTMYGEARGEKPSGREAVAHVVMNRVRSPKFTNSVAGVCLQKKQFSCWNIGNVNRSKIESILPGADPLFDDCMRVAEQVINGQFSDTTGGATHYFNFKLIAPPDWAAPPAALTTEIGSHRFFKNVP